MSTELAKQEPANLLSIIDRVVGTGEMTADKVSVLERLLAMQMTIRAEERQIAYVAALARLTDKVTPIRKTKDGHFGKYAPLEDIDKILRPLLAEEGFAMSFDSLPVEGGKIRVICRLSHKEGFSESKQIDLAADNSGGKTLIQQSASTIAYGRRILTKMFFNLQESGEDKDGDDEKFITENQQRDLQCKLEEGKSDLGKFLKFIAGVDRLSAIPARDFKRCMTAAEDKVRQVTK